MSESFEDVIRRIETRVAALNHEVEQLRADREMLARALQSVRIERDRLLNEGAQRTKCESPAVVGPPLAPDNALSDADWDRLSGNS